MVYKTDVFVIQPQHGSKYMPVKISQKVLYLLIYYILHVQVKVSPNHSEQAIVLLFQVVTVRFAVSGCCHANRLQNWTLLVLLVNDLFSYHLTLIKQCT